LEPLAEPGRYSASGPFVMLPAELVQPVSMIAHELATNARKHGALSTPEGRLAIEWRLSPSRELCLSWRERRPEAVVAPQRHGFGSRLISQLVRQVSGDLRQAWTDEGLVLELTVGLRPDTTRAEGADAAG
ncbi:MAG: hypothetical protein ACREEW_08220, partial [Caulobacteraceae bacterium]